jgi:hypothetical protein
MSEGPLPESSDGAVRSFLEFIALGFGLEAIAALFRGESLLRVGGGLVAGAIVSIAGFKWANIRIAMGSRFGSTTAQVATDFRWWIVSLFVFLLFVAGPSVAREVPASLRGIWFDRIATATIVVILISATAYIEKCVVAYRDRRTLPQAQRGYFDYLVDWERARSQWIEILHELDESANRFSASLDKRTNEFVRAGNDPSTKAFVRLRKVASRMAVDFNVRAAKIERIIPKLKARNTVFIENQLAIAKQLASRESATALSQLRQLGEMFVTIRRMNARNMESWRTQYQFAQAHKDMSQDLNSAIDRISNDFQQMIEISDDIEKGCETILNVINTKLSPDLEASSGSG